MTTDQNITQLSEKNILKEILKEIEFHDGQDYIGVDLLHRLNKPMIEIQGIENDDLLNSIGDEQ